MSTCTTWTTCSEGIHLRGLAQLDPLVAYKNEAFTLFGDLMNLVWLDFGRMIYHVQVTVQEMPPPGYQAPPPIPMSRRARPPAPQPVADGCSYTGGAAPMGSQALAAAAAGGGAGLAEQEHAASGPNGAPVVQQRHTDANEPGRNDPCWCGSGKKYKKCHGA